MQKLATRGHAAARVLVSSLSAWALALIVVAFAATAQAQVLVDLALDARPRPYSPQNPVNSLKQEFSVPGGEGTLIMTYTEERYVGGPGGFTLDPVDLSPEHLGWGGSTEYTPRSPIVGQLYQVQTIWNRDFSKKRWVATLTARHAYQAFQIRNVGQQLASSQRLKVEFIPGSRGPGPTTQTGPTKPAGALIGSWNWGAGGGIVEIFADGTGKDSRGNTMRWTARDAAAGLYELRWSHGFTDTATLSADGNSVAIVNNVGTRFTATRRGRVPQTTPTQPSPPTRTPTPTPSPPPVIPGGLPTGVDRFDSTSTVRGDPFNGGFWSNAANGSAFASRTFDRPVCLTGFTLQSAGSDMSTRGASIKVTLVGPSGSHLVLDMRDVAINRAFSPGGSGQVEPPQTVSFLSLPITRIEVAMTGNGWFLMDGLRFTVVECR